MQTLTKEELLKIEGGGFSAALLGNILKGINLVFELSRNLGSALRRIKNKQFCGL